MNMEILKSSEMATVRLTGDVSFSIWKEFKTEVIPLKSNQIIFDFREALTVDSSIIGMILELKERNRAEILIKCGSATEELFDCLSCSKLFTSACELVREKKNVPLCA